MKQVWRVLTDQNHMWHHFAVRYMLLVAISSAIIMSACFIPPDCK